MKNTVRKELRKSGTEAYGARAITKTEEKRMMKKIKEATVTITPVERKGIYTTVIIDKIITSTSIRLGKEVSEGKMSKKFRSLEDSIEANGIMVPLIVKKNEDDTYTIIDGYRRFEVAQRLGYKKIQVMSYDDVDDKDEMLSIVTNSNQKTLTAIELGVAYKKLIDRGMYGSNRELADAVGVSESTVGTRINNLKLDRRIIEDLIENNTVTDQKVLKAIRTVEKVNEESVSEKQWEVYSYIKENALNRKDTLEYMKTQKESVETKRYVKLESNNKINVMIDTSGLDEVKVSKIEELLAEIEALRLEEVA